MTSNRGFSLIEVLISVVVVVLSGIGTLKLYSYMEVEKSNAVMMIEAKRIAENQASLLQAINTRGNPDCDGKTIDDIESCVFTPKDERFTLSISNEPSLNLPTSGSTVAELYAKILKVEVSWKDRSGVDRQVNLPVTVSKYTNLLE
ncbi:typIV pilin [Enterovibrio norvegicus FF-33]|uniref:prepilin-type N-terminal cleavage/methylation domain-containing protein n=1 Tax=Enterovibrio norvegicus TaxID=188144 RepID=UPI000308B2D7|nr:prepilin-type N-terminal cleavage/methylation domain-containing protein [Enterovibrio norvegicus]OEE69015.1 typIV pilin [Enterovibrio norvegicus FF-33]